jgi:uncharacterized membrane protein YgcG
MKKLALLLALASTSAWAYPPANGTPVVDQANILPDDREKALVTKILAYEKRTGHQLMVATVSSLDGRTIEDYAEGYFETVGVGSKETNDGALFLVAPNDRKARIETGYGMRVLIPDADAHQILENEVIPNFRSDDYPAGIEDGATEIMRRTTPLTAAELAMQRKKAAVARAEAERRWASFMDFLVTAGSGLSVLGLGFGGYRLATAPARRRRREEEEARRLAEIEADNRARAEAKKRIEAERKAAARKHQAWLDSMTPKERRAYDEHQASLRREEVRQAKEAAKRREAERRSSGSSYYGGSSSSSSSSSYSSSSSSSSSDWGGGGGDSGGGGASSGW